MLTMRKITRDWLIAALAVIAILSTMSYLDDSETQQEIAAQEVKQAAIDEMAELHRQRVEEFNKLADKGEYMTTFKARMK